MGFDRSRVSALQEDEGLRVARWNGQVQAGCVTASEARRAFGLPTWSADDVFLRPLNVVEAGGSATSVAKTSPSVVVKRAYGARRQ